jgi:hypothetical protein
MIIDADSYERLADRSLPRDQPPRDQPRSPDKGTPQAEVVACVLEIPRESMARATTELRQSLSIQEARYLPKLVAHVSDVTAGMDDLARLQWMVGKLKELALRHAKNIEACKDEIKLLTVTVPPVNDRVRSIKNALLERKLEVAAKLLAAIPDDE